jgi:hypothetical protein
MTKGWYLEKILGQRLKLERSVLERFRKSLDPQDVQKLGRDILYSPAAYKKLMAELGSPDYDISSAAMQEDGEKPQEEIVELTVERKFSNPRLLVAKTATGDLVRVRVPYNANFQPRMIIRARVPHSDEPQLYLMEGRCPRYPGRW